MKSLPVRSRLFFGIVLIQLGAAVLLAGWYFYTVFAELQVVKRAQAEDAVRRTIEATDRYFVPAEEIARVTRRMVATNVVGRDDPDRLERYLGEQLRFAPAVDGIFVGYPNGDFDYVMRSAEKSPGGTRTKRIRHEAGTRTVQLTWRDTEHNAVERAEDAADTYDPRTRAWYEAATRQALPVWTAPYVFFTTGQPGVTVAAAVGDARGAPDAVVGVDVEMGGVSGFLRQLSFGNGGSVFIVTPGGDVVAHSRNAQSLSRAADGGDGRQRFVRAGELPGIEGVVGNRVAAELGAHAVAPDTPAATAAAPKIHEETHDGASYYVAIGELAASGRPWQVVAIVPAARFAGVLPATNLLLVAGFVLTFVVACMAGYALAASVGRPVAALQRNTLMARNSNIELMEPVDSGYAEIDEIDAVLREQAARHRRGG
jgi:hypothetical protein